MHHDQLPKLYRISGIPNAVDLLIRKGANINLKNNYGNTTLMHAAREGTFLQLKRLNV